VQSAGELDWGNEVLLGCNRETMRAGEMFVLFLMWSERVHAFMPMGGNALLANITSGEVAPDSRELHGGSDRNCGERTGRGALRAERQGRAGESS
jgi:hypothetical protein